jgi:hypothetical protein
MSDNLSGSAQPRRRSRTAYGAGGLVPRNVLELTLFDAGAAAKRRIGVEHLIIAGWTGRDRAAVEKHIVELEALGVQRPSTTPVYYRVSATRLTTAESVEMLGDKSSGEVEFVLLQAAGQLWVGVGSDHTDRDVESYDVAVSKQICDKPIAPEFWSVDDVQEHWDQLVLRSWILDGGTRVSYQEGPVTAMLTPRELLQRYLGDAPALPEGTVMFCGTLAAHGGVRPSQEFAFELHDPVRDRRISHGYRIEVLPRVR